MNTKNSPAGGSPAERPVRRQAPKRAALTPHQKIARAFQRKTGVLLTAADVYALGFDDAIMTRARNDDLGDSEDA